MAARRQNTRPQQVGCEIWMYRNDKNKAELTSVTSDVKVLRVQRSYFWFHVFCNFTQKHWLTCLGFYCRFNCCLSVREFCFCPSTMEVMSAQVFLMAVTCFWRILTTHYVTVSLFCCICITLSSLSPFHQPHSTDGVACWSVHPREYFDIYLLLCCIKLCMGDKSWRGEQWCSVIYIWPPWVSEAAGSQTFSGLSFLQKLKVVHIFLFKRTSCMWWSTSGQRGHWNSSLVVSSSCLVH